MKTPKHFKIKGETWKVSTVKGLEYDDTPMCGLTDHPSRTIQLDSALKGKLKDLTLLHEFIHASLRELHVDIEAGVEEVITDGLAKCLLDNFRMSPK